LVEGEFQPVGQVVAGTVKGDLHDIGKNLVCMMLEGAGFVITDMGVDVSSKKFVAAVREHEPSIVAMSALPTTTMPATQATIGTGDLEEKESATRRWLRGIDISMQKAASE